VRFAYKNYPRYKGVDDWAAALPVQVSNPAKHSPPCRKFEAVIDSGASLCLFHSSIGHGIGLNVEKGELDETIGVSGVPTKLYRHTVSLHVLGNISRFEPDLPINCRLLDCWDESASSNTSRSLSTHRAIHRDLT
jgi:hypothetical protein